MPPDTLPKITLAQAQESNDSPVTYLLTVSYQGETVTLDPSKPEQWHKNYERALQLLMQACEGYRQQHLVRS